jgi:hypothetical protein
MHGRMDVPDLRHVVNRPHEPLVSIEIATRAGVALKIAAKVSASDHAYFDQVLHPSPRRVRKRCSMMAGGAAVRGRW